MNQPTLIIDDTPAYIPPPIHITKEDLVKYKNGDVFIETGTYQGETADMVARSGLFGTIHTIELDHTLFTCAEAVFCENEMKDEYGYTGVKCWHGESPEKLKEILESFVGDEPATFWLDAHASGPLPGGKYGGSPLLDELDVIATSPCKEHTIIIDDCRLFGSQEWGGIQKEDALRKLREINPNYKFIYTDGQIPEDVLWATVK